MSRLAPHPAQRIDRARPLAFTFAGRPYTGLGGDTVGLLSDDRPDRMLCVACWWLRECDLPLPGWAPRTAAPVRVNLAGVFSSVPDREPRSA